MSNSIEKALFEAAAKEIDERYNLEWYGNGYVQEDIDLAWEFWLKRAALATPSPTGATVPGVLTETERLKTALRFYARGEHYNTDESEEFDSVSGEPQNWLCSGQEGSTTMIEDGRVARSALLGKEVNWIDGGEALTPQPIEGEAPPSAHREQA